MNMLPIVSEATTTSTTTTTPTTTSPPTTTQSSEKFPIVPVVVGVGAPVIVIVVVVIVICICKRRNQKRKKECNAENGTSFNDLQNTPEEYPEVINYTAEMTSVPNYTAYKPQGEHPGSPENKNSRDNVSDNRIDNVSNGHRM